MARASRPWAARRLAFAATGMQARRSCADDGRWRIGSHGQSDLEQTGGSTSLEADSPSPRARPASPVTSARRQGPLVQLVTAVGSWICCHLLEVRARGPDDTAYATSDDGLNWDWHGPVPSAGKWDARGARVTSVLPDGRASYDGRAPGGELVRAYRPCRGWTAMGLRARRRRLPSTCATSTSCRCPVAATDLLRGAPARREPRAAHRLIPLALAGLADLLEPLRKVALLAVLGQLEEALALASSGISSCGDALGAVVRVVVLEPAAERLGARVGRRWSAAGGLTAGRAPAPSAGAAERLDRRVRLRRQRQVDRGLGEVQRALRQPTCSTACAALPRPRARAGRRCRCPRWRRSPSAAR